MQAASDDEEVAPVSDAAAFALALPPAVLSALSGVDIEDAAAEVRARAPSCSSPLPPKIGAE